MSLSLEYVRLDATDLARLVRRGEVSATELVEAAIARLQQAEPRLDGMREWTLERARQQSREPLSEAPFAGVPFLLKDNMHVAARNSVPQREPDLARLAAAAGQRARSPLEGGRADRARHHQGA